MYTLGLYDYIPWALLVMQTVNNSCISGSCLQILSFNILDFDILCNYVFFKAGDLYVLSLSLSSQDYNKDFFNVL